jgi:hypothetical protein
MKENTWSAWFRSWFAPKAWEAILYPFLTGISLAGGEFVIRAILYPLTKQDTIEPFVNNRLTPAGISRVVSRTK